MTGFRHPLLITTLDHPPGHRIVRIIGVVRGNAVRARHIGNDILAAFRNIVGGEIREYTKLLAEAREQAIDRMADQAQAEGANAVVCMRLTTSMVMGGAAEMLAYGTAVVVEPVSTD
ncbi:MAG TPA: YbjQ family protein [Polyangiaceae bacterium]|nr:YbjQ family protein [Polyangiaceae bacterium]